MAKRKNKISKKKKAKLWKPKERKHAENCNLCQNYSCLTEKVLLIDQEKQDTKEFVKDPDFKMHASVSSLLDESLEERRASLRPRRKISQLQENEVKTEVKQEPAETTVIKLSYPQMEIKSKNSLKPYYGSRSGLDQFLIRKPQGVKAKLEFVTPKIPMIVNQVPRGPIKKDIPVFLPSTFHHSSNIKKDPPPVQEESSFNLYSELLDEIDREFSFS